MTEAALQFTDAAANQLISVYLTPDMGAQRAEVVRMLRLKPGDKVLDAGSGPGLLAAAMADLTGNTGEVCGVDISTELLTLAAERFRHLPQLRFVHADARSLPFPDAYFDVAVVTQVLEYLPDVRSALTEIRRVLKPGGRVLILDTDWDSLVWHSADPGRMRNILAAWDEHLADPYLPRTLGPRMREAGFQVRESKIIPLFNPDFSEDSFSNRMIDLIGPFVIGRKGITAEDVNSWAQELRAMGRGGDYFFSLNRYVFIGVKT